MLAHADSSSPLAPPIWAAFSSHHDARAALALGCDIFSVSPALEADLASLPSLKRLHLDHTERDLPPRHANGYLPPITIPDMPSTRDIYSTAAVRPPFHSRPAGQDTLADHAPAPYTISSNPPNPKTSFRAGDWIAHNFQRNIACIVCGRPRSGGAPPLAADQAHPPNYPLANPSPRFAGRYNVTQSAPPTPLTAAPPSASAPGFPLLGPPPQALVPAGKAPPPQYPPLTPSGRALSVGGRVRNVSRDPLAPCVMYWPDNEPLPEPCQIRPIDSALITYPPIINTGNKGAAEKQPGDWLCGKCNYHNWRRRKVCQTCFPYAEGNGDSISAAVQAERITLLANVLASQVNALDLNGLPAGPAAAPAQAQTQGHPRDQLHHLHILPRDGRQLQQSVPLSAPPFQVRMDVNGQRRDGVGMGMGMGFGGAVGDSRGSSPESEHFPLLPPLPLAEHDKDALPIYQTSGGRGHAPAPANGLAAAVGAGRRAFGAGSPQASSRTLLPAFLQDIVHSPSLSPSSASSSSADLSFDDGSEEDADGEGEGCYAPSSSSVASAHSFSQTRAMALAQPPPALGMGRAQYQSQYQGQSQYQQHQHQLQQPRQVQQLQQGVYGNGQARSESVGSGSFSSLGGRAGSGASASASSSSNSIWRLDGEESRSLSSSGSSPDAAAVSAGAGVGVGVVGGIVGVGVGAARKSTNDFWQVRYS
ncbi:hypothetical protein C8Q78DRAFT_992989 [Trametes maxima]|nr:hypothetical protein C8Q78DRAFT_992989 [Trametes maxima]